MKVILIFLSITALTIMCTEKRHQPMKARIESPAAYYAMVNKDSVLHSFSFGHQNLKDQHPVGRGSQFAIFSVTKTFTAIAVMQLVESGELNLQDKVTDHLPEYSFLREVTIRHLLAHQSGLNNPLPLSWIHLADEKDEFDYAAFSHNILSTKAKLKRKPGSKAAYSNLNYLLLGEIIGRVSGEDYQSYLQKNVLPENEGIRFHWDEHNVITGYHKSGFSGWILGWLIDKKKFTLPRENGYIPFKKTYLNGSAYGGLISTPGGMEKFLQNLLSDNNDLLSSKSREQMWTEQSLDSGQPSGHSLGWFVGQLNDHPYVHHAGGGGGFYSEIRVYPDLGVASFLFTNISGFSDKRKLDEIDVDFLQKL